jgi:putative Mg2+ transporter-C (MgtC) family protein
VTGFDLERDLDLALRLIVAALLAAILGFQRARRGRAAGMRTHVLVALAAAGFTVAGAYGFGQTGDPTRIAAQVASGVGFLGAGVILREGGAVRGLTTAASIWLAASIGVLAGAQLFIAAAVVAVIGYVTLEKLKGTPREVGHDDEE